MAALAVADQEMTVKTELCQNCCQLQEETRQLEFLRHSSTSSSASSHCRNSVSDGIDEQTLLRFEPYLTLPRATSMIRRVAK